ncbi:MAG: hypothetical protein IMW98_04950 [Firmicutes bacterium]|nr:hypothetical protein [Bacillota bacterium]
MPASAYSVADYPIVRLRKLRRLPLPGEVLVDVGERVQPDQPVARIALRPGIPWVVPVARLVGVQPEQLPQAMLVKVGDRVKAKQVIARGLSTGLYGQKEYECPIDGVVEDISAKSGRVVIREEFGREEPPVKVDVAFEIGCRPREVPQHMVVKVGQEVKKGAMIAKKGETSAFFTKCCYAPISGVIAEVNEQTGHVTIARPFKEVVVRAYIEGTVVEKIEGRGVVVEAPAVRVTGIFGLGGERHGVLRVLTERPDQPLTPDLIDESCKGQIIVGGAQATDEALAKALQVGCAGVIAGTAHYLNLVRSMGVKLGVGITGQEDIDMTVILMEGFGSLAMREQAFRALKALEGRRASINGATQVRAGAIRPEIVVPFLDHEGPAGEVAVADEDLAVGQRVRIINEPYFGAIGTIVSLPREDRQIETEARVPVVEVETESGVVVVPRKNVELF